MTYTRAMRSFRNVLRLMFEVSSRLSGAHQRPIQQFLFGRNVPRGDSRLCHVGSVPVKGVAGPSVSSGRRGFGGSRQRAGRHLLPGLIQVRDTIPERAIGVTDLADPNPPQLFHGR